jgi:signal transduction histidine kinase/CheY-like chemotaxis protein
MSSNRDAVDGGKKLLRSIRLTMLFGLVGLLAPVVIVSFTITEFEDSERDLAAARAAVASAAPGIDKARYSAQEDLARIRDGAAVWSNPSWKAKLAKSQAALAELEGVLELDAVTQDLASVASTLAAVRQEYAAWREEVETNSAETREVAEEYSRLVDQISKTVADDYRRTSLFQTAGMRASKNSDNTKILDKAWGRLSTAQTVAAYAHEMQRELARSAVLAEQFLQETDSEKLGWFKDFEWRPRLLAMSQLADDAVVEADERFVTSIGERVAALRDVTFGKGSRVDEALSVVMTGEGGLYALKVRERELAAQGVRLEETADDQFDLLRAAVRDIHVKLAEASQVTSRAFVDNLSGLRWTAAWLAALGCLALAFLGRFVDVGARKQIDSLEATFSELRAEVTERERAQSTVLSMNRELAEARDAAVKASGAKSIFLANMSHELRTPMNAIIGYSEMLLEDAEEEGDKATADDLNRIRSAGKHLLALINDILDLSKIEAGRVSMELIELNLGDLIADVQSTVVPLIDENSNTLVVDLPTAPVVMCSDETKLRQTLFNLLSNAAKFTEKGEVTLRVRQEGGFVDIDVEDQGIGMNDEQVGKIFGEFTQADVSTTRQYGGTGLGLAITKRFCEMLGGTISVSSELGKGSCFRVHLPLVSREPEAAEAGKGLGEGEALGNLTNRCVLVIDDDPNARELLSRYLEREGIPVVTASDGRRGLELARELRPAAITLDVMMPGMDGWSVLAELKAAPETSEIPVVVVTMIDDHEAGFALGAIDCLTKPVDRSRLLASVGRFRDRSEPGSVLVVDDDESTRLLLARTLQKDGWDVATAEHGAAALEQIDRAVPDVVLLDLMMPVMDGFTFLERLREREDITMPSVLVITAKTLDEEDRSRLEGAVDSIILKSSDSRESLLAEIHEQVAACMSSDRSSAA